MTAQNPNGASPEEFADDADDTGVTVFEGTPLRLMNLALDELAALSTEPSPLAGAFRIRLARTDDARQHAGSLVQRRYESRGYDVPRVQGDPNLYTFVAYDEGNLVGTVSLRLDSNAGLSADGLYREEIDDMRKDGMKLCEFTRLAVDVSAASKPVLAALFHTAYLFAARVRGFDAAVIEVNPRHVVFYLRALAFEVIGPERMNDRVNAPAVLMRVRFNKIAEGLEKYAGNPELASQTRTLFPFGFSAKDAEGILGRLLEALGETGGA